MFGPARSACPDSVNLHLSRRTRQENVLRLEIPVDDPFCVRRGEHVEQMMCEREHLVLAQPAIETQAPFFKSLAVQKFHDQESAAVGVYVVVGNFDGAIVRDGICDVAFAQEALSHERVCRDFRMQDFDRDAAAVSVRRGVDGGHAADAEQHIETPLFAKHPPNA